MINAVSFRGEQPKVENKEKKEHKKTHATAGFVLGAAAGAGVAGFTSLGKVPQYADADTFMASSKEDITEVTKDITGDTPKANVKTLVDEKEAIETRTKAVDTKLEAIFGKEAKEEAEVEISKVLNEIEGTPKFEELKATVSEGADKLLVEKETGFGSIKEAADKLKNGEEGAVKVKDSTLGTEEFDVKIIKNSEGKVTFIKGSQEAVSLDETLKSVSSERKAFDTKKALATKLRITQDTAADTVKVKKSEVKVALDYASKTVSEEAKTAFGNIQELLPKHVSGKMVALYAAAGAVVAGLIGHMIKKKEDQKN